MPRRPPAGAAAPCPRRRPSPTPLPKIKQVRPVRPNEPGVTRRAGIHGSSRRAHQPDARDPPQWTRRGSTDESGTVVAGPGCDAAGPCCSGAGLRSTPGATAVGSRSTSNPDTPTGPFASRNRWRVRIGADRLDQVRTLGQLGRGERRMRRGRTCTRCRRRRTRRGAPAPQGSGKAAPRPVRGAGIPRPCRITPRIPGYSLPSMGQGNAGHRSLQSVRRGRGRGGAATAL